MDPITSLSVNSSTRLDSSLLGSLDDSQQLRLSELLDEYLEQISRGETPDQQSLIDANPLLSRPLKAYLEKIDELHNYLGQRAAKLDISGEILGDFQLVRPIGRGGMGIVYQAWQLSLNRSVAVKVLPSIGSDDSKLEKRFENEARAAAMLEHHNIVPIYATGKSEGVHYYAMRLIDGASLDEVIEDLREAKGSDSATRKLRDTLLQFADLADALQSAHEVGVIHRDIKPSNILQDADHKLWITDFGLARIASFDSLTRTGEMIGTMRYMSPEQATGRGEIVDHRTDIYSLAVTLYELLALHPYIEGEDGPELLSKIAKNPPPRLKNLPHKSSHDIEIVIQRAAARHKDDRYQSAAEFRDDLRRIALGASITTTRPSRTVRAIRWGIQHYRFVSASFLILLVMAALLFVSRTESERAQANLLTGYEAVENFNNKLIKELAQTPGAEDVREEVVLKSLGYSQDFVKQDPHDLSLLVNLGTAYTHMGNLQEEQGKTNEAIANYRLADETYNTVLVAADKEATSRPINMVELRRRWLDNQNHLALAILYSNNLPREAAQILESTVQASEEFHKTYPSERTAIQLAVSKNNYGTVLLAMGERASARREQESALDLLKFKLEDSTLEETVARTQAAAHYNLGVLESKDSPEKAVKSFNQALGYQLGLTKFKGNAYRVSPDIIKSYIELGTVFMNNGKPDLAIDEFGTAQTVADKFLSVIKENPDVSRLRAIAEINLGLAHYRNDQKQDALLHLESGIASLQQIHDENPKSDSIRIELGFAIYNHAKIISSDHQMEAIKEIEDAEEMLEKAAESLSVSQLKSIYESHLELARSTNNAGKVQLLVSKLRKLAVQETTAEGPSQ